MDDLQQVTITFDGGRTSVNFAQAALVLQGTASVYSKKVDFLWQMVLKTTDLLRNQKNDDSNTGAGDGQGAEDGRRGRRKNVDMTREFELLTTEIGKNIDLKLDEEESISERKNALNFIYVTPRQLIEKEGSEQKSVKVNLYMGVSQAKWDLLAAKEDFRINGQYVVQTGYLGEELNVDNNYLNLVNDETVGACSSEATINHSLDNDDVGNIDEEAPAAVDEDVMETEPVTADDDANVSVMSERAVGHQNVDNDDADMISSPPPLVKQSAPRPAADPEPVFDPWEPLDPHQDKSTPRPIKVKKTFRLPPSLKSKKQREIEPISEYLNKEMTIDLHKPGLFPYLPSSLSGLAHDEYERRKERERNSRKERLLRRSEAQRNLFPDNDHNNMHEQDEFNNDDGNDFDAGDEVANDNDDIIDNAEGNVDDDLDLPNPHVGGDVGALIVGDIDLQSDKDGSGDESLSYEEMVAKKVEEFVAQSREFMRSSELAMKVANWHEMIGPRLETVERRNAFDIHSYGSSILNNFSQDRKEVTFNSVVRGQKPEEKSRLVNTSKQQQQQYLSLFTFYFLRYFLSMLMLANTENVEISTTEGTDPQLGTYYTLQVLYFNLVNHRNGQC